MPYLRSLGVDGVWLDPFYNSPQHDHGNDVSDYFRCTPSTARPNASTCCFTTHTGSTSRSS